MALPYSFQELPDTYIIFITEKDFYGLDKPVYSIERINLDTGKPFEDGEHILYVNDEYRGESDMGKLMHDFNCTRAEGINFELLAELTRYLKNDPKGVQEMSKIMEDMRKESIKEARVENALCMIKDGELPLEKIALYSGLSLEEVEELAAPVMA